MVAMNFKSLREWLFPESQARSLALEQAIQLEKCLHLHVLLVDVPRLVYGCCECGVRGKLERNRVFTPLSSFPAEKTRHIEKTFPNRQDL